MHFILVLAFIMLLKRVMGRLNNEGHLFRIIKDICICFSVYFQNRKVQLCCFRAAQYSVMSPIDHLTLGSMLCLQLLAGMWSLCIKPWSHVAVEF